MATSGAVLRWYDLASLRSDPWVLGLAEVMNFPGVIDGDDDVLDKLRSFAGAAIDGHAPRLARPRAPGVRGGRHPVGPRVHDADEAREKLRLGMTIFIREGSVARNLSALLPLITPANQHRICFCTDDRQPSDLMDRGHIDGIVRAAIDGGLDPMTAIRLATLEHGVALPALGSRRGHARPPRRSGGLRRSERAAAAAGVPRRPARRPRRRDGGAAAARARPASCGAP